MDNDNKNVVLTKNKIKELVRHAALERACVHTREENFTLKDVIGRYQPGQILGNWMSLILVTGENIRITLKLHFAYNDIKRIVYPIYGVASPNEISDQQAMDFVKELSNLIAGYLVQVFEENDISLGISLPLATRGFYEIFADYTPSSHPLIKYSDLWSLTHEDVELLGSVMIEISDIDAMANILSYDATQAEEDDGEFDFL